jgi:hypothetical protein
MKPTLKRTLLASTILGLALTAASGASARYDRHHQSYRFAAFSRHTGSERVSYRAFHRALARHGDWVYSDRWGEVWIPSDVPRGFHPYYTNGHWANTREYGWLWVSDYDWGDITFHYGRWVNDPDDGWMWIPGYVWSPGWVVWRSNNRYTGWMPMPPDEGFLRGDSSFSISLNFGHTDDNYGYSRWYGRSYDENRFASNWVFVGTGNLADRDYRPHAVSTSNVVNIINTTTNVTNYTVVNNHVVNRSIDARAVEQAAGHPVVAVSAATVVKSPALITPADTGRAVQVQMRQAQPQGTGAVSSAPRPSAEVVNNLSTRPVERNGQRPAHLFTRATVADAPLKPAPAGAAAPAATAPMAPVNGAAAPAPSGEKPAGNGRPETKPGGAMTTPTTPADNNPMGERGGKNRDKLKGGAENQGGQQAPTPAPTVTTPGTSTAPAEMGVRNRDRNKNAPENKGGAPEAAPTQTAPGAAPPAANNPPTDMGKRNRDRNKNAPETKGGAPEAAPASPTQTAPSATAPAETPAETGGRNRDRHRGDNQGAPATTPPTQTAPSATPPAETPAEIGGRNRHRGDQGAPAATPPPAANTPGDTGGRKPERRRGEQTNPEAAPTATPPAQTTPAATPPAAKTPEDKAKDRRKHKDNKDDTQTNEPPQQ